MEFPEGALTKAPEDFFVPREFLSFLSFYYPEISKAIPAMWGGIFALYFNGPGGAEQ